jgi:oxygen-independent coproporphyrinogen-3 oxidase
LGPHAGLELERQSLAPLPSLPPLENHSLTGLYLHIPFCAVKCRFCDFAAFPGRRNDVSRYLNALLREMKERSALPPRRFLETFYVGGGTPSILEPLEWRALLAGVRDSFDTDQNWEATLECNPDSVTDEKLNAWQDSGMNRLSVGLQSDDPALLAILGRTHTYDDFVKVFRSARAKKFHNLNVDLMYGLPGQTLEGWTKTLRRVLETDPDHLSAYGLQIEETTYFHRSGVQADDDLQADMYEAAADMLESAGYIHYEISNFAKPGFECRHNLRYWRNQECLGVGVSSAWYDGAARHTNTDDLTQYMDSVETQGTPTSETVRLPPDQQEGENLMLAYGLRKAFSPPPPVKLFLAPPWTAMSKRVFWSARAPGTAPPEQAGASPTEFSLISWFLKF